MYGTGLMAGHVNMEQHLMIHAKDYGEKIIKEKV